MCLPTKKKTTAMFFTSWLVSRPEAPQTRKSHTLTWVVAKCAIIRIFAMLSSREISEISCITVSPHSHLHRRLVCGFFGLLKLILLMAKMRWTTRARCFCKKIFLSDFQLTKNSETLLISFDCITFFPLFHFRNTKKTIYFLHFFHILRFNLCDSTDSRVIGAQLYIFSSARKVVSLFRKTIK